MLRSLRRIPMLRMSMLRNLLRRMPKEQKKPRRPRRIPHSSIRKIPTFFSMENRLTRAVFLW